MADAAAEPAAADQGRALQPLPPPLPPAALKLRVENMSATSNPTKATVQQAREAAADWGDDPVGLCDNSYKNIINARFGKHNVLNWSVVLPAIQGRTRSHPAGRARTHGLIQSACSRRWAKADSSLRCAQASCAPITSSLSGGSSTQSAR